MNTELPPTVETVAGRRSVRSFLPAPVPRAALERILAVAACAPSDMNLQPWRVHIVQGATRDRLCQTVLTAAERTRFHPDPSRLSAGLGGAGRSRSDLPEPLLCDAQECDPQLGVARTAAWLRNFDLFGAPVGLFLSVARSATTSSWLDCGMFLQNVMLVALGYGLDTCAQRSWCDFDGIVCELLGILDSEILICGLALGYANIQALGNGLGSERKELDAFVRWLE